MKYFVDEVPAASWAPGLEPALACYRVVNETQGTILETPDATEQDKYNAETVVRLLNAFPAMSGALRQSARAARQYERLLRSDLGSAYPAGILAEAFAEEALVSVGLTSHNTETIDGERHWNYSDPRGRICGPDPLRKIEPM
ncbi:hypothetical protein [Armatimonas sp.]|uniref:hypothetical protein n=1 Tax=Armatimonas sp. TaxID=1872638 RepID=UPI003751C9FA